LADENALPQRFERLGLDDYMGAAVGSQAFLRSIHGLSAEAIAAGIVDLMAVIST
jgi:hypothetical protein